ncbi:hypothetical protein L0F63_007353, partial [Massospora cicadina]
EIEILSETVKVEREEKDKMLFYNQKLEEKLEALEVELDKRCDKYIEEIEKLSEVQHSKYLAEEELGELSRKLFEEANKMVAEEAK